MDFVLAIPLMNRIIVPLYYTSTFSYGYDSNVLKFSDEEQIDSISEPWVLGDNEISSSVFKLGTKLNYIPYLFDNHETKISFKLNYSDFLATSEKKYFSYSFKISQHLAPFSWLKLSYSLLPDIYLRDYIDKDNPVYIPDASIADFDSSSVAQLYVSSFFSNEVIGISYSNTIPLKNSYYSVMYSRQKQFYNSEFNEFDLEMNNFKIGFFIRNLKHFKFSTNYTITDAVNITLENGQFSSSYKDRGFKENKLWFNVSTGKKYSPYFDNIGFSLSLINRKFTSILNSDPLHIGRSHIDSKISISCKKNLMKNIDFKVLSSYRFRNTLSDESFVEDLKSFKKYDFFIQFIYNSNLNFYY